jgi:signal transduction histidine kinase/CHASE3 domain sensor protein/CheY-like chemotaxis protein
MPSQRVILATGLAILLIISAATINLDVKSRSDAAWVNHTLRVLNKLADIRLLIRRAESAARGFVVDGDPGMVRDYNDTRDQIAPAFADLRNDLRDNPAQAQLADETEAIVVRRLAVTSELLRLQGLHDKDGIAALLNRGEGRSLMETVGKNFDRMIAAEQELLATRTENSRRTGAVLLAINLSGAGLILLLVALLVGEARRAKRELETSLTATQAANQSLEGKIAERTAHLLAANEQIRHSTAVLQNTFNSMAEAVLVIDTRRAVVLSNPAAERMLRYKPGMNTVDVLAQSAVYEGDGVTPITGENSPAARVLRGEPFTEMEIVLHPHGARAPFHLLVSGRPLREKSGAINGAALVYHDITKAREIERQLQQAQKLDAIGKLTGGIAHDFNNMLTVIGGTAETLVAELSDQPDLKDVASLIDEAAQRCAELVQRLLAFARKQPLQPRNVDINSAVVDIAKLLRPTLGEQIEIETVLGRDVTSAHIDPSQLANSVLNMAINARDAMPGGGKLVLETQNVELDDAYADDNAEVRPGRYVMIAVSDSGSGMPAEVRDKAFEPFFTTKEVGKGSGLGLSMVYGFVKQSGGHIKIYSEVGHGTTIKLYLPPASEVVEQSVPTAAPIEGGAETILVVEDDMVVRNFVITQLQSLGYRTIPAADGQAALNIVARGEPFDLLFTDVVMPGGMSGRELAEIVVKLRPGIKVLYTSGYTENAIVHHGRLDEGVLLLAKPYRKGELAEVVRRALGAAAPAPALPDNVSALRAQPRQG